MPSWWSCRWKGIDKNLMINRCDNIHYQKPCFFYHSKNMEPPRRYFDLTSKHMSKKFASLSLGINQGSEENLPNLLNNWQILTLELQLMDGVSKKNDEKWMIHIFQWCDPVSVIEAIILDFKDRCDPRLIRLLFQKVLEQHASSHGPLTRRSSFMTFRRCRPSRGYN